jgi:hypothetical protein
VPFFIEILIRLIIEAIQESGERKRQQGIAERVYLQQNPAAPPPPSAVELKRAVDAVAGRIEAMARAVHLEAARCAVEEANRRFAPTLAGFLPRVLDNARRRLAAEGARAALPIGHLLNRLQSIFDTVAMLAEQRRDRELALLLGDSDALAEACYGPVIAFARGHGIRLASEDTATFVGDKSLAIWLGFDATGLAPIVLPSDWAAQIAWWPALAHEIGHDFHASVTGLDRELRVRLSLPANRGLPDGRWQLTTTDVDAAFAAWLPEIFADCFGTLMLGPAFVHTMIWSFADPERPQSVRVIVPDGARSGFEEHSFSHLRVLLACNLLSEIGFPADADHLEADWRRRHKHADAPDGTSRFYLPTRIGNWLSLAEETLTDRGAEIVRAIYEEAFDALAGIPLRSIPGLDLGPREHQAALDARAAYFAGRAAPTRDARALIAGAVLAWHQRPDLAPKILRAARATIPSVGIGRRRLRERAARDAAAAGPEAAEGLDPALARDAILLSAILDPPPGLRRAR